MAITGLTRAQLLDALSGGARSAAVNDGIPAGRIADYLLRDYRAREVARDMRESSAPSEWRVPKVLKVDAIGRQALQDLAGSIARLHRIRSAGGDTFGQVEAIIRMADEYVQLKTAAAPGKALRGMSARRRLSAKPTDPKEPA